MKVILICFLLFLIPGYVVAKSNRPALIAQVEDLQPAHLEPVPVPPKYTTKAEVIQLVKDTAAKYGVNVSLALSIVNAESGFNCGAQNKHSSAGGLFQFINSTWLSTQRRMQLTQTLTSKYNCVANAEAGMYLLSKGELSHWNASAHIWRQSKSN